MEGSGNSNTLAFAPKSLSFRDRIANLYYKHGLFCASHPYSVILLTLFIASLCCYPLCHKPILGNSSQKFTTPLASPQTNKFDFDDVQSRAPRWFQAIPLGYIQQIFIKTSVSPWQDNLVLTDSFRAPLAEVFRIVESVNNYQFLDENKGLVSLSQLCLQVDETLQKSVKDFLPQYGCLIISPAAIWNNNINKFQEDSNLLKSIFERHGKLTDATGFREILFGIPWKESGIKKFLLRTRQRVLTYSVTIVYSSLNVNYTLALQDHLLDKFSSSQPVSKEKLFDEHSVTHIYFEDNYTMAEFIPLGFTYIILCLYIYFSVRKIDLVKYKWALAISAVFTVIMSLLMSVGLCVWFGLNPNLNGSLSFSEILPYLVVVIGLENMLVLTKSVVSTPVNLDVKIRIAQGLSKEGLSITKNLLAELALLAVSFFTFVPAIQEFCLFAVVGLLSDFFLQMVFFITILSIDIRRLEVEEYKHTLKKNSSNLGNLGETGQEADELSDPGLTGPVLRRTRLTLTRMRAPVVPYNNTPYSTSVFAPPSTPILAKIPKRLRFFHFWARTRMVQRGLMFGLVVWIMILVYNSGIVEHFTENATTITPELSQEGFFKSFMSANNTQDIKNGIMSTFGFKKDENSSTTPVYELKHHNLNLWQSLPPHHWTNLFGFYNISLLGRYITMLPPIHLSIPISPTSAIQMRHPSEMDPSLTAYFKKYIDKLQDDDTEDISSNEIPLLLMYQPSSTAEIILAVGLALPTLFFLIYFMVILYRCICPKHYAEWRSSWKRKSISNNNNILNSEMDPDTYLIMETLPIKLVGHHQEIEAMVSDENIVCSVCLSGDVRIWDAMSGECLSVLDRSKNRHQYERNRDQNYSDNAFQSKTSTNEDLSSGFHWSHTGDIEQNYPPLSRSQWASDSGMSSPTMGTSPEQSSFVVGGGISSTRHNNRGHRRSRSENFTLSSLKENVSESPFDYQPVWCMNSKGSWLILGCAGGRVELWDTLTGTLISAYNHTKVGVTSLHLERNRLYVARMNGVVEFLLIDFCESSTDEVICHPEPGSFDYGYQQSSSVRDKMKIALLHSLKAHSKSITVLTVFDGHLVTGSQDHLMKVFYCDTGTLIYTLHGHSGALSALHIDQLNPSTAASGCQEGMVCIWDLLTGTCVYNIHAHEGPVLTLMTTPTYLISLGSNDCVCIWDKNQGHLIHSIRQPNLCNDIALLTNNILVTANQNRLVLWDTNFGEALRVVNLGMEDHLNIRHLRLIGRAIVCCYGNELCVVHFPAMTEKGE